MNEKEKSLILGFCKVIVAFASTWMLANVLKDFHYMVYSYMHLIILLYECYLMFFERKKSVIVFFFCYAFSFMLMIGLCLSSGSNLGGKRTVFFAGAAVGLAFIVKRIIYTPLIYLGKKFAQGNIKGIRKWSNKRFFWVCVIVLLCIWLPTWLAFYPGIWGYDVPTQMQEQMGSYTTHHPLLHTLMLHMFYQIGIGLGSPTIGVAINTVFQMVCFAMGLAYLLNYLYRRNVRFWYLLVILSVMAIFPVYPIMAITATKDVLFCTAFIVCFVTLAEVMGDDGLLKNKKVMSWFIISAVLTGMFRNNAKYAIIMMLLCGIIYYRKQKVNRNQFIRIGVMILLIMTISDQILIFETHAAAGSKNEMLSVPYQQISRVYKLDQDELSDKEKDMIKEIIPEVATYAPGIADNVKGDARGLQYKEEFFELYIDLLKKYPYRYAEAFLFNTMGYWYVDDTTCATLYGNGVDLRVGYFWLYSWNHMGVENQGKIPELEHLYLNMFCNNQYLNYPIISCLFNFAIYIWIMIAFFTYSISKKNRRCFVPFIFIGTLLVTYLLGPCACVRYVLPFMVCLPICIYMAFSKR